METMGLNLHTLTLFIFWITVVRAQGNDISQKSFHHGMNQPNRDSITIVQAIVKGTALLPCDLSSPVPNDNALLVVWYKNEHTPIYSYDTRGPYSKLAKHWQEKSLDTRAFFRTMTETPTLSLDSVNEMDEGDYTCRIDYLRSPTKNFRVRLIVIVPPQKPKIIGENGNEVSSVAGPYEGGEDVKLTCIVSGGKPQPYITWWKGDKPIKGTETRSGFQNVLSSQLTIRGLSRSDLHTAITCKASNNNISQPVSTTTTLDIQFQPLGVEIFGMNNPLSAERQYEIPCQTYGSRPSAQITWIMDGKELKPPRFNYTQSDSTDGNVTTSTLTFVPTRLENGRSLSCRASNHFVRNGVKEASVKLNVFYAPIPMLTLGSNLNPDDIEEGDDVYFECKVNANPWAYKVLWKHNGKVMQHDQKGGIIISSSDLALQGITKGQTGNYSCIASNVEGDGESNVVSLKIMYKPTCVADQKRIYGVAKLENAEVLCEVEAYPPPDNFKWSFNNTAELIEVPQSRYQPGASRFTSRLSYTPKTDMDYGTVMCWASNLAGQQREPCVFHIITASKPDPPFNCSIVNQTSDSVEVECSEGYNGGLPQYFILEVHEQQGEKLLANVSSNTPLFGVTGLEAGKELRIAVYGVNTRGTSDPATLEGYTLKVAEKQTVLSPATRDQNELHPVLGILVGLVCVLSLLAIIILWTLRLRGVRRKGFRLGFLTGKEKAAMSLRSESEDLFEKDEKNPDVIPTNKDSNHHLESAAQTPGPNSLEAADVDYVAVACEMTRSRSITPSAEGYAARDKTQAYNFPNKNSEVTYAELALARPSTLPTCKNGVNQPENQKIRDDPTIYAQIDHSKKAYPQKPTLKSPPLVSPVSSLFPVTKPAFHQREVITIRTPLMGHQQESCV
ncbi:nephrin isoform X2 [Harmonia axyridis]|uniref:nephrin isoform X2 n=1 Tax=Harmonia axyridis TaxID=115357 RepID=UPI001E279ADD|nr:nephrin isoform X2 [Harmonia axyridis]